jgi:hypothetical protein
MHASGPVLQAGGRLVVARRRRRPAAAAGARPCRRRSRDASREQDADGGAYCWSAQGASPCGYLNAQHARRRSPLRTRAPARPAPCAAPARGARPGRRDHHHELARRVEVDQLAENAARLEGAIAERPPLVAVAARETRVGLRLVAASSQPPAGWLAVDARALEDELAEARVIAQAGLQAAATLLIADVVHQPGGIAAPCRRAARFFRRDTRTGTCRSQP